jgi:structure-specific recognition protein 1
MSGLVYEVVAKVFRSFSDKKIIGSGSYSSYTNEKGVKCTLKTAEGHLYFLEKTIIFLYKPVICFRNEKIKISKIKKLKLVKFGKTDQASRFFEITVYLKDGKDHIFSNLKLIFI